MAEAHTKHHDYHLVDPSPWPAVGATSVFLMAFGGISWMHHMYAAAPLVASANAELSVSVFDPDTWALMRYAIDEPWIRKCLPASDGVAAADRVTAVLPLVTAAVPVLNTAAP